MVAEEQGGSTSLANQAYDVVERMIVTLELAPGTVFSEIELSGRIGIGRTPLREALQRLASGRLVVAIPRRGVRVTEINASEYLVLLETRRVLDRLIATRACRRGTEKQKELLRECAQEIRTAALSGDIDSFMRLDRACDEVLEGAAANPFAIHSATPLHAHCRRFWSVYHRNGDLCLSAELHGAMMEAVANGTEEEASRASDTLIDYLERFTKEALELV